MMESEIVGQQEGMASAQKWSKVLFGENSRGPDDGGANMKGKELDTGKRENEGKNAIDGKESGGVEVEEVATIEEPEKPLPPHLRCKMKKLEAEQEAKRLEEMKKLEEVKRLEQVKRLEEVKTLEALEELERLERTKGVTKGQDSDMKKGARLRTTEKYSEKKHNESGGKREQTSHDKKHSPNHIGAATALYAKQRISALAKKGLTSPSGSHETGMQQQEAKSPSNGGNDLINLIDLSDGVSVLVVKPTNGAPEKKKQIAILDLMDLQESPLTSSDHANKMNSANEVPDLLGDIAAGLPNAYHKPAIPNADIISISTATTPVANRNAAGVQVSHGYSSDRTEIDPACPACLPNTPNNDSDINTTIRNLASTIKAMSTSETNRSLTDISRLENKQIMETNTAMNILGNMQMRLNTIDEFQSRCLPGGDIYTMLWNVKKRMDGVQRQIALHGREERDQRDEEETISRRDHRRIQMEEKEGWEGDDTFSRDGNGGRGYGFGGRNGGSFRKPGYRRGHRNGMNGMNGMNNSNNGGGNGQGFRPGFKGVPTGSAAMNANMVRSFRTYR